MIQTHAYDAWVQASAKASFAYRVTRELGAIPAPIFVFLAGLGVAFGETSMLKKGNGPEATRARFVRRGLEIVLAGYLVSAVYAWMDGAGLQEIFRADILHAIGLSLVALAVLVVGRARGIQVAAVLVFASLLFSIALTSWAKASLVGHPWSAVAALVLEVPPYSRFPLFPTLAFAALGYLVGRRLLVVPLDATRALVACAAFALVAVVANVLTNVWVAHAGAAPLSRAHPALVVNFVDGSARALAVTAFAVWLAPRVSPWLSAALVRLGQGSLWAYAFHIPFCYGRAGRFLAHKLDMRTATACVVLLMLATWAAVRARDWIKSSLRARRDASGTN